MPMNVNWSTVTAWAERWRAVQALHDMLEFGALAKECEDCLRKEIAEALERANAPGRGYYRPTYLVMVADAAAKFDLHEDANVPNQRELARLAGWDPGVRSALEAEENVRALIEWVCRENDYGDARRFISAGGTDVYVVCVPKLDK